MKEKILKIIKEIYPYALIILVVILIRTFIITPVTVDQVSMNDTLYKGDVLLLKKFDKNYERFEVIVFKRNNDRLIKRVIALPGEKIKCVSGIVYVNNEEISNEHIKGKTDDFHEVILGDDEYFVMGDNRENSMDSRMFGPIKKENILGTTDFRIFPFNKFGNF